MVNNIVPIQMKQKLVQSFLCCRKLLSVSSRDWRMRLVQSNSQTTHLFLTLFFNLKNTNFYENKYSRFGHVHICWSDRLHLVQSLVWIAFTERSKSTNQQGAVGQCLKETEKWTLILWKYCRKLSEIMNEV